jgi:hypothetical protein
MFWVIKYAKKEIRVCFLNCGVGCERNNGIYIQYDVHYYGDYKKKKSVRYNSAFIWFLTLNINDKQNEKNLLGRNAY